MSTNGVNSENIQCGNFNALYDHLNKNIMSSNDFKVNNAETGKIQEALSIIKKLNGLNLSDFQYNLVNKKNEEIVETIIKKIDYHFKGKQFEVVEKIATLTLGVVSDEIKTFVQILVNNCAKLKEEAAKESDNNNIPNREVENKTEVENRTIDSAVFREKLTFAKRQAKNPVKRTDTTEILKNLQKETLTEDQKKELNIVIDDFNTGKFPCDQINKL